MSDNSAYRCLRGFTLVELVVVIVIVGVLAAYAAPRLIAGDTRARIAAVDALAGALDAAAYLTYSMCTTSAATSGCSTANAGWQGTIAGNPYWLNYGWPDAGDQLNAGQIDSQVNYSGFTAVLVSNAETQFQLIGAPTPANCSVSYYDAYFTPPKYHWVVATSGC